MSALAKESAPRAVDDLRSSLEEADRRCGLESLYFFNRRILGYKLMRRKPHAEVADFIQSLVDKDLTGIDLEPRGTFKTTQISQGLPVWLLIRNPDLRILLDSSVLQNSIDNLRVIKSHFENNERLRYLYGDFVGSYWVTEEMTIRGRKRLDFKEPSVRCASVERVQVGPHYDVIIADDLVSEQNSKSHEGRQAIIDHFKLLFSLLEPGGICIIVGTRWHFDDLYGFILDKLPQFKNRIRRAIEPDGTLYFPERLGKKFLDDTAALQGRDLFSCQYLNDPSPEDANSTFQRTSFKRYDHRPAPAARHNFITIDPGGEKKGSDQWVIFSADVDANDNIFFDDLSVGNWQMKEAWDVLFAMAQENQTLMVGLETTGGQKWLYESLVDEMRRRKVYLPVKQLAHAGDSKEYRIKRLQPRYQAGRIFHSAAMGPLETQLLKFPKGADDVADAAAMVLEICYPPRLAVAKELPPQSADEYFLREHRKQLAAPKKHALLGECY